MKKKTVLIVSLIHMVILLCMFLFYCKLPQDPAQNPQNVEITILTEPDNVTAFNLKTAVGGCGEP